MAVVEAEQRNRTVARITTPVSAEQKLSFPILRSVSSVTHVTLTHCTCGERCWTRKTGRNRPHTPSKHIVDSYNNYRIFLETELDLIGLLLVVLVVLLLVHCTRESDVTSSSTTVLSTVVLLLVTSDSQFQFWVSISISRSRSRSTQLAALTRLANEWVEWFSRALSPVCLSVSSWPSFSFTAWQVLLGSCQLVMVSYG